MKKVNKVQGFKVSADQIAKQLRQAYPKNPVTKEDNALKIASKLSTYLHNTNVGDVNHDFFPIEDVRKNERIWTQVRDILGKK